MNIDFNTVTDILSKLDLATASSLASLFSFFKQIQEWRENQRREGSKDTIDQYLESLRRQNHNELVNLIVSNQSAFQRLFEDMESSIVAAVQQLDANQERRHIEVSSLDVKANDFKITYEGFTSAQRYQAIPEWTNETLDGWLVIVNRSRSNLTLSNGGLTIKHGDDTHATVLHTTGPIAANGGSFRMKFRTERTVRWKQGEVYSPVELTLEFHQSEVPFRFGWQDGRFVPF